MTPEDGEEENFFDFEDLSQYVPQRHGHGLSIHMADREMMEGGADLPPPPESEADDSKNHNDLEEAPGECKELHQGHDEKFCTRLLLTFAIGLVDMTGRKLGDLKEEPYSEIKQKNSVKPTSDGLKTEIVRRAAQMSLPLPKCKNWSIPKCMEYLESNPIVNEEDRNFVYGEERKLCELCLKDLTERKELAANRVPGWTMQEPHLRFIHCIIDDSACTLLATKDNCYDRASLDARNSSARPPTWYEKLAELFNDPSNNYVSEAMPDLHDTFKDPIQLPYDEKYGVMTADAAKSRFADMRAKTIVVS